MSPSFRTAVIETTFVSHLLRSWPGSLDRDYDPHGEANGLAHNTSSRTPDAAVGA
jgi:hypothetical protein